MQMNVMNILESMDYGLSPESRTEADQWLENRGKKFGHYIAGAYRQSTKPNYFTTYNPATGEELAQIASGTKGDVDKAVDAAVRAQKKWNKIGGYQRARYLYAIARSIQRHARLLAVLETLDNGKPIRETRDLDIPLVARHFYFHAGLAQLGDTELSDRIPHGVCGQIIPWNFPLLMLAWKVAPAIALGNTVVLKPSEHTPLSSLFFAEILSQVNLPAGVVNIVTGDGITGEHIVRHTDINKIAFTGSTSVGKRIRHLTAKDNKSLTLELGGKSPFIVCSDADLDSAVEGIVDAIWLNQGEVCCAGSRLLVQESIADTFLAKVRKRMNDLRVGSPLDKSTDIGSIISQKQRNHISEMVALGKKEKGTVYQPQLPLPQSGFFYPPTLVTGLTPSSVLMREEIFGPVLVSMTFRTHREAISLANNSKYGLAASVWSENINMALEISYELQCGVVWINSTNAFDAAAGFGGYKESGFGREGGWEGIDYYTKPKPPKLPVQARAKSRSELVYEKEIPESLIDQTPKLYIGGRKVRPDGGNSLKVFNPQGEIVGTVGKGNRKDIRNAVEAARSASSWKQASAYNRSQILYFLAENLAMREKEFARRIELQTMCDSGDALHEVRTSIETLFYFASWADKFEGKIHQVAARKTVMSLNEPVGIVGVVCPNQYTLWGFVVMMAALVSMGNRCVVIPSETSPLSSTDFSQILDTSDVPAGVVNLITGNHDDLVKTLVEHEDIDAIWFAGCSTQNAMVNKMSVGNLKRIWLLENNLNCWYNQKSSYYKECLKHSVEIKNIWIPFGE